MRIGILGTGTLAAGLGQAWAAAGHELTIGGRSPAKASALASRLGPSARAGSLREAAAAGEAVLLAVLAEAVPDTLATVGADALDGRILLDPTNAVEHGVGVLLTPSGSSGAEQIAALAPGARVVKAFHLFQAERWTSPPGPAPTVAICGDDPDALATTEALVRDVGGTPFVVGGLARARQLEEVAGFVIALAFGGANPPDVVPAVLPAELADR